MTAAVEMHEIAKTYPERTLKGFLLRRRPARVEALKDVTLSAGEGEILGLVGPNGAGKTTLLKILATLVLPDRGAARIHGYDAYARPEEIRRRIGLVNSNERSFYWRLSGRRNLEFFAALYNIPAAGRDARIQALLDRVGLREKADLPFMKYSSGQQQRMALARALLPDARVLLMDEPTRSLDPLAARDLASLIRNQLVRGEGKTILWASHNLKEIEEVCDRVVILHRGRVVASDTVAGIRFRFRLGTRHRLLLDGWPPGTARETGFAPVRTFRENGRVAVDFELDRDRVPFLLNRLLHKGIRIYSCESVVPDLWDALERLTRDSEPTRE